MRTVRQIAIATCILGSLVLAPSAHAAPVFFDNFEDGNTDGWLETHIGGGAGSSGVQLHNGSQMAFVEQVGADTLASHALSRDLAYASDDTLSFTMQAIALEVGGLHATSGVTFSFLTSLNSALGSFSIRNTTIASYLGPHDIAVDSAQHDYSISFADLSTLAGLDPTAPISKLEVAFFGQAQSAFSASSAQVWFDNVKIEAVPIPASLWLFGSALAGLGVTRRRKS